jgi:hypothetical protein
MKIRSVLVALLLFCFLMPGTRQASAHAAPALKVSGSVAIASFAPKDNHYFRPVVIAATNESITVRDRRIRTFTYLPNLAARMQDIVAHGNYQPDDNVEISCHNRTNEAYAIDGNPPVPR